MPTKDPDDPPATCRVCGKPFAPGEARYRGKEGDVHPECRDRERRPPDAAGGGPLTGFIVLGTKGPIKRIAMGMEAPGDKRPKSQEGVAERARSRVRYLAAPEGRRHR